MCGDRGWIGRKEGRSGKRIVKSYRRQDEEVKLPFHERRG